jgi:hypothetical protein
LICWKRHTAERVKDWENVFSDETTFREAQELKCSILLKDTLEFTNTASRELVVRNVKNLEVSVHRNTRVWLQSQDDVLKIFVTESRSAEENDLKLLPL